MLKQIAIGGFEGQQIEIQAGGIVYVLIATVLSALLN